MHGIRSDRGPNSLGKVWRYPLAKIPWVIHGDSGVSGLVPDGNPGETIYRKLAHAVTEIDLVPTGPVSLQPLPLSKNRLASSQINRVHVKSTGQTRLTITEPTPRQRAYVSALQCDAVLEDRPMKSWSSKC